MHIFTHNNTTEIIIQGQSSERLFSAFLFQTALLKKTNKKPVSNVHKPFKHSPLSTLAFKSLLINFHQIAPIFKKNVPRTKIQAVRCRG